MAGKYGFNGIRVYLHADYYTRLTACVARAKHNDGFDCKKSDDCYSAIVGKQKSFAVDHATCLGESASSLSIDKDTRLTKLSPTQLDVLELVALRRTSKEIARQLNISPVTVDQRIKRIQHLIGANSRSEAARYFLAAQAGNADLSQLIYDKTIYQSSGLAEPAPGGQLKASLGERNPAGGGETYLRQSQAMFNTSPNDWSSLRPLSSVLEAVSRREKISVGAKTLIVISIMIVTIITFALLVTLAEGLSRII